MSESPLEILFHLMNNDKKRLISSRNDIHYIIIVFRSAIQMLQETGSARKGKKKISGSYTDLTAGLLTSGSLNIGTS